MAEFVTKSIDNLSHGLTVKNAMETLGLKEYVWLLQRKHLAAHELQ